MRKLALLVTLSVAVLLALSGAPHRADPQDPPPSSTRVYDITRVVRVHDADLPHPAVFSPEYGPTSRSFPVAVPDPSTGLLFRRGPQEMQGYDAARVELFMGRFGSDAPRIRHFDAGGRKHAMVTGNSAQHRLFELVLNAFEFWERVSFRMAVFDADSGKPLGSASGRPGEPLVVRDIYEHAFTKGAYLDASGLGRFEVMDRSTVPEGIEVSATVMPLSDGRLRVQGRAMEVELLSFRERLTTAGQVRLPQCRVRYQPFVGEGHLHADFTVTTQAGRKLRVYLSPFGSVRHMVPEAARGRGVAAWNVSGLLYDVFDRPWRIGDTNYGYSMLDTFDERFQPTEPPDPVLNHIELQWGVQGLLSGGLLLTASDDTLLGGESIAETIARYETPPRSFRVRVWNLPEGETPPTDADPVVDAVTSSLSGQMTGWYDLDLLQHLTGYEHAAATSGPPAPVFSDGAAGHQLKLVWTSAEVVAELRHAQPLEDGVRQFHAGPDNDERWMVETRPMAVTRLHWRGRVGGTLTAVGPVGGGRVLYGVLEPLD